MRDGSLMIVILFLVICLAVQIMLLPPVVKDTDYRTIPNGLLTD